MANLQQQIAHFVADFVQIRTHSERQLKQYTARLTEVNQLSAKSDWSHNPLIFMRISNKFCLEDSDRAAEPSSICEVQQIYARLGATDQPYVKIPA